MKGALEMQELNYVAFENEFVKFCSGDIDTELEYGGEVKPTRENIDRYILLPAAMTKDEKRSISYSMRQLIRRHYQNSEKVSVQYQKP